MLANVSHCVTPVADFTMRHVRPLDRSIEEVTELRVPVAKTPPFVASWRPMVSRPTNFVDVATPLTMRLVVVARSGNTVWTVEESAAPNNLESGESWPGADEPPEPPTPRRLRIKFRAVN